MSSIEKALYSLPQGQNPFLQAASEEPIEFDIEGEPGMAIVEIEVAEDSFDENLAEKLEEGELSTIGTDLKELVEADITSRKDWVDNYIKGLEVLGMRYDERTEPWKGACGVYSTVLAEAAIRFQSETIMETFPAAGPVKVEIIGEETPEKSEAAVRVRDDMN